MNYINLSSDDYCFKELIEVNFDEQTRVDVIIANLDELCKEEQKYTISSGRNSLYSKLLELCSFGGQRFILLEASENFLYSKSNKFQEVISRIQRTTHYQFEIRGVCSQSFKKERQIERFRYFILFYPQDIDDIVFDDFDYIYCIKNYTINSFNNKYNLIIDYIFYKIRENLL